MDNKKNKTLAIVLGIFALVIVTTAASFAFFTYSRTGTTTSTIISGDIEFSFIEGDSATLANAFPVADNVGAVDTTGEYEFDVRLSSSSNSNKMNYNVLLVDNNDEADTYYFNNEQIKFSLVKNNTYVANTSSTSGVKLSTIDGFDEGSNQGEGIVLQDQEITAGTTDNYKLRIWISDDVNYSNTVDGQDNQESIGKYNSYKYSLKVKVTSGLQTIGYNMGGYLLDQSNNPLINKTIVMYSETPHYIVSDSSGYIYLENIESGDHELYYMGDTNIDSLKSKSKNEIINSAISSANITTSSKKLTFDNIIVSDFIITREDNGKIITLKNGTEELKRITNSENIQLKNVDVSNYTNIYSNNGSQLTYKDGIINVSNIKEDSNVILSTGLGKTTNEMDDSENYVLMLTDEDLSENFSCWENYSSGACINNKKLTLNVNDKKITSSNQVTIFSNENSNLQIIGNGYIGNDKTVTNSSSILIKGSAVSIKSNKANICNENPNETTLGLCIYGQFAINNLIGDNENYTLLDNVSSNGQIVVKNGNMDIYDIDAYNESSNVINLADRANIVNINGGNYVTATGHAFNLSSSTVTLNINDYRTYVSSENSWGIYGSGIVNINSSKSNKCTSDLNDTTSGLCLYAFRGLHSTGKTIINNGTIKTKTDSVYNRGDMTINGGEFYSENTKAFTACDTISSTNTYINGGYFENFNLGETINGTTYGTSWAVVAIEDNTTASIKNVEIKGKYPLTIYETSTLNMCSGKLISTSSYDLHKVGVFNYSSSVIFTDGTNNPNVYNTAKTLNPNYTGTCSR